MAKVKYTAIVAEMRNSISGTTFSKNRYGNYARTKVTPVNPQTVHQQNQRSNLASLSQAWKTLTQSQRDQWGVAAQGVPRTDIFGDSKILSGQALYISANLNILGQNGTPISSPGIPAIIPQLRINSMSAIFDISLQSMVVEVNVLPALQPADTSLVVYATPGINPGQSFVKNRYRKIFYDSYAASIVTLSGEITDRFGNALVGQTIYVKLAFMDNATGALGVPQSISAVVTSQA